MSRYYTAFWLRSLGCIHTINFGSLIYQNQILHLVGKNSIGSLEIHHNRLSELSSNSRWIYMMYPSIYWFCTSDYFILFTCIFAMLSSCHLMIGSPYFHSRINLYFVWIILLSICTSGGEMFAFPWDWLLLEATLLSMFLPRLQRSHSILLLEIEPDPFVITSLRWLCCRFYLAMGLEKLPFINKNEHWTNMTYLKRFYETEQPMPTFLAYYAYHLPMYIHKYCCIGTWIIEIIIPILILLPFRKCCTTNNYNKLNVYVALILSSIQLPIFLTGNYSILNILSIALTIPLLSSPPPPSPPPPPPSSPPSSPSSSPPSSLSPPSLNVEEKRDKTEKKEKNIRNDAQKLPLILKFILIFHSILGGLLLYRSTEGLDYLGNTNWIFSSEKYDESYISTLLPRHIFKLTSTYRFVNQYGGVFHDSFQHDGKLILLLEGTNDEKNKKWNLIHYKYHVSNQANVPYFFHPYFPRLDHYVFYVANGISFNNMNPISPLSNGGIGDHWLLSFVQKLLQNNNDESPWLLMNHPEQSFKSPSPPYKYIRAKRVLYRFSTTRTRTRTTATDGANNSSLWWNMIDSEVILPSVCLGIECGASNVVSICQLLKAGNKNHCQTFQRNSGLVLKNLHNAKDPSNILFHDEEFLLHWLMTVPESYLERLKEIYDLGCCDDDKFSKFELDEGNKFSDKKLIKWALQIMKKCSNNEHYNFNEPSNSKYRNICLKLIQ